MVKVIVFCLLAQSRSSLYSNSSHIRCSTPNGSFRATGIEIRDKSFPIFFFRIPHKDGTSAPEGAGTGSFTLRSSRIGSGNSEAPLLLLLSPDVDVGRSVLVVLDPCESFSVGD